MTSLNLMQFQNMTQEQFVSYVHTTYTIPFTIFIWLITIIIFFALGLILVNQKKKYMLIFFACLIASGIILLWIIFLPNSILSVITWFKSYFNF